MNTQRIVEKIKATINQFYSFPNKEYIERVQQNFMAGVLQTSLHLLPSEEYFKIKHYIYDTYGYDPGGCTDGQISIADLIAESEEP